MMSGVGSWPLPQGCRWVDGSVGPPLVIDVTVPVVGGVGFVEYNVAKAP